MSSKKTSEFGRFRSFLWPIRRGEYKKFIPMFLIFFLISFNYNLLRASKDTMIVTAPSSGAEAIPFLKVWFMLPMAFLMTFIFTRLSNRYQRERVFYIMLSIFLGFFTLFTFLLYPNRDLIHPHQTADFLETVFPVGLKGMIALIRNWSFSAFYVMSELWSAIIFSVLFWGFANEVTNVSQAKRFYALFGLGANFSGILSGQAVMYLSSNIFRPYLPYGSTAWEQSVLFLNLTIIITGVLIMLLFRWLNRYAIEETPLRPGEEPPQKVKMSLRKNFRYLAKSKYLLCIALIVMTYNLGINLVEIVWKNQVKALYPNPSDFNTYMGQVMTYTGIIATVASLFITGAFLRRFSWTTNALIPAAIMFVTGICFFGVLLFTETASSIGAVFGMTPMLLGVSLGTLQNCLSRASKYSLFDATKELSFIPLSKESKLKGKAAIDGVGSRLGKSGGSLVHQGLLLLFSTIAAATPVISIFFLMIVGVWMYAVTSLGKQFHSLTKQHETIDIPDDGEGSFKAEPVKSV